MLVFQLDIKIDNTLNEAFFLYYLFDVGLHGCCIDNYVRFT